MCRWFRLGRFLRNHGEERRVLRNLSRNPLSVVGILVVAAFFFVAVLAPVLVPYPKDISGAVRMSERLQSPSAQHFFGTDDVGRDIFSRVLYGTRVSLMIGGIIILVGIGIGVPLGLLAGFSGGWLEEVIMRLTDVFLALPGIVLAIVVVSALGPGIKNAVIALSLVWWPGYVRLVYGKTKGLRQELYIEAARAIGARRSRILFRHILPNCVSTILVKASMDMGMAILSAAGLGFIGIGAQPPSPEWGAMISAGRRYLPVWWWYATFPGLAIWFTVLGFNFLGDALRDALDPRMRTQFLR